MTNLKSLIQQVGIEPERLEMFNLSAAMGPRWAEICMEFSERVKNLGPSPIAEALRRKAG